ncbi:hypothetical protein BD410DRAFT_846464 [Rickenella mellea]|uniref:F-box domain-containing protein n=1 Tax=Rickenella mellea TaxID=50990 RepID=A0A4Y7PF22_9AGAM|nr:hypothetical protein BD410DRAFT_846464 [Rickenella mellea]
MADSCMLHCQRHVPPILQIPCEVTSEIFKHCLPDDEFPRPSVKSGPVQLSHVCSTWLMLAIRTPHLWSKILLCTSTQYSEDTKESFTADMESHVEALEVWMRRAKSLLLSVHIRYPTLPPDLSSAKIDKVPFMIAIVKYATRWKDVRLDLPGESLAFARLLTQHSTSKLETFHIKDTSGPAFGFGRYCPVGLKSDTAETLSTLSAHASIKYRSHDPAPFVRLRTVSLKHTFPEICLHLLKYCPVLEDLNLSFHELHSRTNPPEYQTILVPQLRNFHLSHTPNGENGERSTVARQAGEIGIILDRLQLPRLQSFSLWMTVKGSARYHDPNLPWDYLSRLISRSNCSLNRLELQSPHLDTPSMLECLRLSPELNHLGIPADDELERNAARLLPSLDSLHIFKC